MTYFLFFLGAAVGVRIRRMVANKKPLWRCPKCRHTFVTRNLWHSCTRREPKALFAKCEPVVWKLYQKYLKMARKCGPVALSVRTDAIVFRARVRYAGCKPRKSYLLCTFSLRQPITHSRIEKLESYGPRWHAHFFRVSRLDELDATVQRWLRASYRVGTQDM